MIVAGIESVQDSDCLRDRVSYNIRERRGYDTHTPATTYNDEMRLLRELFRRGVFDIGKVRFGDRKVLGTAKFRMKGQRSDWNTVNVLDKTLTTRTR